MRTRQKDALVSTSFIRGKLGELDQERTRQAPFLPDYVRNRDEWLLAEFQRIIREAETEYVSTGVAEDLTGWDAQTVRKYARAMVAGDPLPPPWDGLVAMRDGRDYAVLLASIPVHPSRRKMAS
jgi:hypothetical protein